MKRFIEIVQWHLANARPNEPKHETCLAVMNDLLVEQWEELRLYHTKLEHQALLNGDIDGVIGTDEDGNLVIV